jgi:NADH:ubiquinone oxidoreductase subunit K
MKEAWECWNQQSCDYLLTMGGVFPIELDFNSLNLELVLACNSTLISEFVCYLFNLTVTSTEAKARNTFISHYLKNGPPFFP